jgi:hypothetical protein
MAAEVPANTATEFQFGESDLLRIERALLDAILDVRADDANAVDQLLNDPKFAGDRAEVERFLAAAVMDTHPSRNRELDQLLGEGATPPLFRAHA